MCSFALGLTCKKRCSTFPATRNSATIFLLFLLSYLTSSIQAKRRKQLRLPIIGSMAARLTWYRMFADARRFAVPDVLWKIRTLLENGVMSGLSTIRPESKKAPEREESTRAPGTNPFSPSCILGRIFSESLFERFSESPFETRDNGRVFLKEFQRRRVMKKP